MIKVKLVVKSVRFLDALSHRCIGTEDVARPTSYGVVWSSVTRMTESLTVALSHFISESQEVKWGKLKVTALVNGLRSEKKLGIIKR